MSAPTYTDPARVTGYTVDAVAPRYGVSASGYGGKIPTRYGIHYAGRWRRVYAMAYGNAASLYVVYHGAPVFLDVETEHGAHAAGVDA